MTLRLLVDECILHKLLLASLREVGHDVLTVNDIQLRQQPDGVIFAAAIRENRLVITFNCADFIALSDHAQARRSEHPGILLVFRYASRLKNMSADQIVKSIANLESANIPLQNKYHILNYYNY